MSYGRSWGDYLILLGIFIFIGSVETIMWDSFEKKLDEKLASLPAPQISVTVPEPAKEAKPDVNKVCSTWLFSADLKTAKEQICRK